MATRRSTSFNRRQELMKTLRTPTISEIKTTLGLPLSLIVFEESDEKIREDVGLVPHLYGPGGELWVSPSDLLIGKVCLSPPLTQKHVQALTHEGILEIGAQIEQKYWNEMKLEKEEAVNEKERYLTRVFELEKTRLRAEAVETEQQKHNHEMETVRNYFENKLNELIWSCYAQVQQLEENAQAELDSLNVLWQEKLEYEIQNTVEKITEEFLEKLRLQEQVLVNVFTKQIETLNWKHKCALDFEKIKSKELMLQLRHHLECQNIANLMYVLCKERRKCKEEKIQLENYYEEKIKKLKTEIAQQAKIIKNVRFMKNKRQKQLRVREKCLIEILRQFQKFIYFALNSSPTQGEFLLNIDKLIKFELDDYCIEKKKQIQTSTNIFIEKPNETLDFSSYIEYPVEEFLDEANLVSLSVEDDDELEESDALPAFFFNEKMYVREDFRDMFSAGIEMDKKHSLWNRDVEELINIFKQTIAEKRQSDHVVDRVKSHHSSVRFHPKKTGSSDSFISDSFDMTMGSPKQSTTMKTQPQSVLTKNKSPASIEEEELEIRKVSLIGSLNEPTDPRKERKSSRKSVSSDTPKYEAKPSSEKDFEVRLQPTTQSKLTLVRDSIILRLSTAEKKSLQNISKMADESMSRLSEDKEKLCEFEQTKTISEPGSIIESPKSTESLRSPESGSKATSRLTLAQDSVELIRSTIGLLEKNKTQDNEEKIGITLDPHIKRKSAIKPTRAPSKGGKHIKTQSKKASTPSTPKSLKIVGARKQKEQPVQEFTEERVKSLVNLMKENPSLMRLFTKCSK